MYEMGINALYCKPNLSQANQAQNIHICSKDWLFSAVIRRSYIPMAKGFVYLCAVIDWRNTCVAID